MPDAPAASVELEPYLAPIEEALKGLLDVANQVTPEEFAREPGAEAWSIKRILEHVADTNNFVHSVVVIRARNLASLRCIAGADFHSPPEAIMTIRVSHRRVLNQMAGLTTEEFTRPVPHPPLGELTVQRVLEMMAEHYQEHARQIQATLAQYQAKASHPS